jgi:hypothetical protein
MELGGSLLCVFIVLAVASVGLGLSRDMWFARRIGREVAANTGESAPESVDPTVEALERLHGLYESGALTESEYESQKKRILRESE